ncbi:triose-phosphate isomerase family protein [Luteococcus sp. OSA5]|uniref:triose-phosphate isomerase family protein n=1 Tax=Luteococcus sp. OSA5 TaxID=3401630 RepID=UPI003B43C15A
MSSRIVLGVSLKMYFTHAQTLDWCHAVARVLQERLGTEPPRLDFFVAPSHPCLVEAVSVLGDWARVGAQDVAAHGLGAWTGEVSAAELAEIGVDLVELGHAERREHFGEDDEVVAKKCEQTVAHGMVPLVCVGEKEHTEAAAAAQVVLSQLEAALGRIERCVGQPVMVAYEPWWAIGADRPAPAAHVRQVCDLVREGVRARGLDAVILYGGTAGPGTLPELHPSVDGLFLGRRAHDPANVAAVIDEALGLLAGPEEK